MLHEIYPLVVINDPAVLWGRHPTYLVCEVLFLSLMLLGWVAAARARYGAAYWTAAVMSGAFVELATVLNSEIGNFYHSQATVMLLGQHEPLYMLFGCFGWLSFVSMTLSGYFAGNLPPSAEAALGGLLSCFYYGLLDTVGLAYLWWTWHTSEPLYDDREVSGVPVASSFWITNTLICTTWLMRVLRDGGYLSGVKGVVIAAIAGPVASMVLMNVLMVALYHPVVLLGYHGSVALNMLKGLCCTVLVVAVYRARGRVQVKSQSSLILAMMLLYTGVMTAIVCLADPAAVRRFSYGQPLGGEAECSGPSGIAKETSMWGAYTRESHLCPQSVVPDRDQFDLRCTEDPASLAPITWNTYYTLCGVPKSAEWYAYTFTQVWFILVMSLVTFFVSFKPLGSKTKVS